MYKLCITKKAPSQTVEELKTFDGHPVGVIELGHETNEIKLKKNNIYVFFSLFKILNCLKITQPQTSVSISIYRNSITYLVGLKIQ